MRGKSGRHVLFLQGPGGTFFNDLSRRLEDATVRVSKINVCAADWLFWRRNDAHNFRGKFKDWQSYLQGFIVDQNVTDVVLFSDSRPYHRTAKHICEDQGINLFAFENGYLRPDWITLELGGVNGNSCFPRSKAAVQAAPAPALQLPQTYRKPSIMSLYGHDILFHFANTFLMPMFPHYRRHRQTLPIREAAGWLKKGAVWWSRQKKSNRILSDLLASKQSYFLYALQLEHDFQLIEHSPFGSIRQASQRVIASFAANAPSDLVLLVKNHPLDNFVADRRRDIVEIAQQHGVSERVVFIDTGNNPDILNNAKGLVSVNSTLGTSALFHKVPVCALGKAVYDIEGLTHQFGLDTFWNSPTQPCPVFFDHFRRALINACQIHGRFVANKGRDRATEDCANVIQKTSYNTATNAKAVVFQPSESAAKFRSAEKFGNS